MTIKCIKFTSMYLLFVKHSARKVGYTKMKLDIASALEIYSSEKDKEL